MGVGDGDPGQPVLDARTPAASSLPCPTTRALCVSTQSTSGARLAIDASRSSEPRMPIERMRDPDQPALLAGRGDRLDRRQPRRDRPLEEHADQVAVERLDLLADDHRQPGRRQLASLERHVDPVVVRDRQVRQPAVARRLDDVPGADRQSKLPCEWQCRSMNARVIGGWRPSRRAHGHR